MTTIENFDNFDFSALEENDFSVGNKANTFEKMNYIGGSKQTWPIDVRIVVNMVNKDEAKPYHENHFHEYIVNDQYVRVPCARAVGEVCAICDAHWDHKAKAEKLATRGANSEAHEEHAAWKRHTTLAKQFEQKKRFSVLVVLRGDNKISILDSKPQLTKKIFGDKFKNEPGAIAEIKSYGVPVFNPNEPTGWLTLGKTGQGLGTVYSAKPALLTKIVGKKKEEQLVEEALHPQVLEKFQDMSKLPALHKMIKDRLWTPEEVENYVASEGTQLPTKVLESLQKRKGGQTSGQSTPPSESKSFNGDLESAEFDPF